MANLKRLQQENEQLKKELDALRGGAPAVAEKPAPAVEAEEIEVSDRPEEVEVAEPATASDEEALDEFEDMIANSESEDDSSTTTDKEMVGKEANKDQRSAEELLSEFEKMLG